MGKIALIFDTETGNTNRVGTMIARTFPPDIVDMFSAAQLDAALLGRYSAFIVGTPTLERGDLADNWQIFMESDGFSFVGKTVALYGLGDQVGYPQAFADGLGALHERLVELGARVVGSWPTSGYSFESSRAVQDGKFVGLVLDQDNQPELTKDRVTQWVSSILEHLLAAAG